MVVELPPATMLFSPLTITLTLLFIVTVYICATRGGRRLPGPIRWPLVGNTFSVPQPFYWSWYLPLKAKYGSIFQVRLLRDDLVVVSDPKIAEELLGRRANNYSSRKYLPFAGRHRSTGRRMLLMPYGPDFMKQRTAMQLMFRPEGVKSNRERQRRQALKLLLDFQDRPGQWNDHLKGYSSGIALGIGFGMSVAQAHRRMPDMLGNTRTLGEDLAPGRWMVEIFPILDILPDALAPWRAKAREAHEREAKLFGLWAEEAHNPVPGALQAESLVAQLWRTQETLGMDDKTIAYVGGSVGEAGTNTTQCTLACFLYACALYPEVMKRAQAEIDEKVGERLPEFSDYSSLPFLFAVVKEVLRWIPVTPLALPHLISKDDQYNGYHIPGGGLLVSSVWNMHRDPDIFSDPDEFNPLRFYKATAEGKLPPEASLLEGIWTFGIGRRACPGRRLGADSVWLVSALLLWTFDITGDGTERDGITAENPFGFLQWRDGVNIEPSRLPLRVTLRSKERSEKVREVWAAYAAEASEFSAV